MRIPAGLLAALTLPLCVAPAIAQTAPVAERVEVALETLLPPVQVAGREYSPRSVVEVLQRQRVPAVSIVVIDEGRIAWARAFGIADASTGRPATPETLFQAASISKPVAASAALALVEQDRLSLDRPVNDQLVSWRLPDHSFGGEPVTLRRLLTHSAGLTVSGFLGYEAGLAVPTIPQILDGVQPANSEPVRVGWAPGSRWQYSGGGITVAQLLMTDVTGEAFPDLMDRLVLRPTGMNRSTYQQPLPAARRAEAALGHNERGEIIAGGFHTYPEMAAAGLWTTPTDLARWALAVSAAFRGEANGPLRPESAQAMLTPGVGGWGLGVQVGGEGDWLRFSHTGSNEGYRAVLIMHPRKQQGIVVMTNGDNGGRVFQSVSQAVGRMFGWPEQQPRMITPTSVAPAVLAARVGRYEGSIGAFHVALADTHLVVIPTTEDAQPFELIPQPDGSFVSPQNSFRVNFTTDPRTGSVTGMSAGNSVLRRQQ